MFDSLKELFFKVIKSRLTVLTVVMVFLAVVLVQRLFTLQIVEGKSYLESFTGKIEKERTINGSRGNIYDRNGNLLASNELSYTVTVEDNGSYDNTKQKNRMLNAEFDSLISILKEKGDDFVNDFYVEMADDGSFQFTVEGSRLQRFRADVYGRTKVSDLKYNKKLGYNEASATADQIIEYLCEQYNIRLDGTQEEYAKKAKAKNLTGAAAKEEEKTQYYDAQRRYEIMVLRYALAQNAFQKYVATTIAKDVSDETVAVIKEHTDELQGVEIAEDTKRVYYDAESFSNIIGYTGTISSDEYEEKKDDGYDSTDSVGKTGIEQAMEDQLKGKKGKETVYVNNTGKVLEIKDSTDPESGNDVCLSIDANLQKAVYRLLEQELAGILYSKVSDVKTTSGGDNSKQIIPIYDVYKALIGNSVLDIKAMATAEDGTQQHDIYQKFVSRNESVTPQVESCLKDAGTAYKDLSEDMQSYMKYIVTMLQDSEVFDPNVVDSSDSVYQQWKDGTISVRRYLEYAISKDWIDISYFNLESKYADSETLYSALVEYVMNELSGDREFEKLIYETLIMDDVVSGRQLCLALYEQGVLDAETDSDYNAISSGSMSSYTFLKNKIKNLQITPAQLALNPCSGSVVITNPNDGSLLACVSYPGYDNNKLSNATDSTYYNKLYNDKSLPLYNNATQQTTAPGSTFKMVTATAGLTEGVITTGSTVNCNGTFDLLTPSPHCWIYPRGGHGAETVSDAIRDSCNVFFYDVGYRLSMENNTYNEDKGVELLTKYAQAYGLGDKTGIEITESSSKVADEYPVTMAIGQSNNSYTTIQLARYVTAVANSGTVYNLTLLQKVTDHSGNELQSYGPTVKNSLSNVASSTWDAIHYGMRQVVQTHSQFNNLGVDSAGKTGTAQQANTPNHALFVGYAPYDNPQIALAIRIANGYTSSNSAELAANIYKYYFNLTDTDALLSGTADAVGGSAGGVND